MGKPDTPRWQLGAKPEEEIVFSEREGYVWASWPGTSAAMRLGRSELVAYVMSDFLAQEDVAKRLSAYNRTLQSRLIRDLDASESEP